jgi:galactokinase
VLQNRSRHVIRETERVQFAVDMFINEDLDGVGCMLNESHYSLRDKYEVSCEELDVLTDLARNFGGVYGSRLTGAGFGGCTVTLVHPDEADDLMDYLMRNYYTPRRIDIIPFVSTPAQGAEII